LLNIALPGERMNAMKPAKKISICVFLLLILPSFAGAFSGEISDLNETNRVIVADKIEKIIVYHGNIKSYIFHKPGCRYYDCKKCVSEFHSREEAIDAGYRPCKKCKP
jgi:hypothetical protein